MGIIANIIIGIIFVLCPMAEHVTMEYSTVLSEIKGVLVSDNGDTTIDYFVRNPFVVSEHPPVLMPDSLGGTQLKGHVAIRLLFDSCGVVRSYNVMRFKATARKPKIDINYRYGEKRGIEAVARFRKWLDGYVKRVKVKRISGIPLPHAMNEPPPRVFYLTISIDFNRQK